MTEFNKCTCVKVNKEKMDLIKAKGLNLQDILDRAMDEELNINKSEGIEADLKKLDEKINKLIKQRDESVADCEKKIDILMKSLVDLKNREAENFNREIKFLELKREYLTGKLDK